MAAAFDHDLQRLHSRAFHRADWAEGVLRKYHNVSAKLGAETMRPIRPLYEWMFVPPTLWPFNIQDVLDDCLGLLSRKRRLPPHHRLLLSLLCEPPDEAVCAVVADHELRVQKGTYENIVRTQAKYRQQELAIKANAQLRAAWKQIKSAFDIKDFQDHKGVIRRTMGTERNLRLDFSINMRRRHEVFQAVFDAFCMRWNLYGMHNDEPLLLKLSVNQTPHGTTIHIPAYWSFDPKRDICWSAIAKLHRTRVQGRQGNALAEGVAERMQAAEKLLRLDQEVVRHRLKGEKKHEFLCAALGWDPRTSPKRLSRLRSEFKHLRVS
jgi:hypothetical protein